ncbi:MAG: winged helix-turn-helix transcriptional regulator [Thermoguttaceae bacterium]|jgi:transcriptional regulator with XRE-family HTH domain|nr:winged helix-turn-helix transcriptional regulator [Thermoguttaceae bacterium]
MIAPSMVDEIRRLLSEGRLSQRAIARRTGISRGTVAAIASGRRPDYEARRRAAGIEYTPPRGKPVRCPGCGGLVQMPCLACQLRQRNHHATRRSEAPLGSRGLSRPAASAEISRGAGVWPAQLRPGYSSVSSSCHADMRQSKNRR